MSRRYFEDFKVGETWESPPSTISAEEIIRFGQDFDSQPMHTDPEAAAAGPFKGLVASGWHIAALAMRAFVRAGGYGNTPMVGLGIDELRWQAPLRAGDTITVKREVVELRRSTSNPTHGIVRTRVTVRNQDGATLMTLITAGRISARGPA
jgi:acyl dehydratase